MASAVAPLVAEPGDARGRPRRIVVCAIALLGGAAAAVSFNLSLAGDYGPAPYVHAGIVAWITLSYVLCGLIAWWRRPESRFGPLLIAAGFAPALSRLAHANNEALATIGEGLLLLPPVLFLHVFLAYPSGRLVRKLDRSLVIAGYSAVFGFDLLRAFLESTGLETAANGARAAQRVTVAVIVLGGLGALVWRRQTSGRKNRRSPELLAACFGLALVGLGAGIVMLTLGAPGTDVARWIAFGLVGTAPILLLIGHLRAGLARSAVGDFFVELGSDPEPAELRDALARALRDPSVRLVYWLPEFGTYADLNGRAVSLPDPDEGQAVTLIDREGTHIAALLHDPSLDEERKLLEAVTAAAGIALENGRLHAELRARLAELHGSRARIVEAALHERQRLERNLHDGAQQRLVALSLELSLIEANLDEGSAAKGQLDQARREIAASLDELREIARGIHPAVVSGHGLAVALEQLAARASVPVRLTVEVDGRLPEPVEVAGYYVVSESLTNVSKYANASAATIEVSQTNGLLLVEVADDGIGGVDTERGTGLRGLADRVEALGGRLRVWSPVGGGTRVRAEIPCA
jgi:signal transduction histidine kinase